MPARHRGSRHTEDTEDIAQRHREPRTVAAGRHTPVLHSCRSAVLRLAIPWLARVPGLTIIRLTISGLTILTLTIRRHLTIRGTGTRSPRTIARLLIPGLRRHLPVITVSRHGTWRIR